MSHRSDLLDLQDLFDIQIKENIKLETGEV
jgi:hypothetical protein